LLTAEPPPRSFDNSHPKAAGAPRAGRVTPWIGPFDRPLNSRHENCSRSIDRTRSRARNARRRAEDLRRRPESRFRPDRENHRTKERAASLPGTLADYTMDDTSDVLSIDSGGWHEARPSSGSVPSAAPDLFDALHRILQTTLSAWEIETCLCAPDGSALRFDSARRRAERREAPGPQREIRRREIAAAWHHNQR
jgi:hypothetical protein